MSEPTWPSQPTSVDQYALTLGNYVLESTLPDDPMTRS